ncbi:calcium-dependent lipid-binding protein [Cryptomeria japonica]|uniref:calcium-dependent lipid-binding protein n=1 Tax=Cryptomeria japonica TaxID=3369 RepID=UPI0025ABB1C6|nr:calcium-dependent lipid-binding protein [Cryptomeria japonica]
MGLISGIVFGIIVGISVMAGMKKAMAWRSLKRISKAVDVALLGGLNRDDLKRLCGDNYPEWISFPLYEQVKWLNKQLSKMWPSVADAAEMVIRESVEPLLEQYRPPGISALKFNKLFLGNVAPKIEGIRIQSLKKGQLILDLDLRWGGDPSIILGVQALVASLPIQLKDLQVFTVVRVIFQLAEEIPCISAVVVALLSEPKPKIDYTLKAIGGSLTAIPGLSDMIDDIVNSIVSDTLQWPHRIVVPIGVVGVDTSELELKPQGRLNVTVVRANSLKNMEMIGKSDPYVILHVRILFKVKTKVIDNNLNPEWNETFALDIEDKETQYLILEVLDKDIGQDKSLGIVKYPLLELEPEKSKEVNLKLLPSLDTNKIKDKKDRGTITIKVHYHEYTKEEQLAALEEEKLILEQKKKLKEAGLINSTADAIDGAVSLVGTGVGGAVSFVGSGVGFVGTGIVQAGRFMGRTVSTQFGNSSKKNSTPSQENGTKM